MVTRFDGDVPYGVMSSAYPWLNAELFLAEAVKSGAQEVELSALDSGGARIEDKSDHVAAHLDVPRFVEGPLREAKRFAEQANDHKLGVCFGNYDRIHSENPEADEKALTYMLRVIDYAAALGGRDGGAFGVDVGMFWGWDRTQGPRANLDAVAQKLYVLARYAENRNVRITSENCHMPGGWPPKNDAELPQQVMRSAGSTLTGRLYIINKLLKRGISPETVGFTWDPSHPETEGANPLIEAGISFEKEPNVAMHIKGHNPNVAGEEERKAYFGGPAMPGWFAEPGSEFYNTLKELGVPIGDCAWAQQYGRVTLPGVGNYCVTPFRQIYNIAKGRGFNGRAIAENETPEKGAAVARKDAGELTGMYKACLEVMRPILWKGDSYNGKPFEPLNPSTDGIFKKMLSWKDAQKAYPIPK